MSNIDDFNAVLRAARGRSIARTSQQPAEAEPPRSIDYGAGPRQSIDTPRDPNERMRRWLLARVHELGTRTERVVIPTWRLK